MSEVNKQQATRTTLLETLEEEERSAFRKYRELFVGTGSLLQLFRYELLTLLISPIPGALGMFLRKALYTPLFLTMGRGTVFGHSVTLRCPGRISLGANNFIDTHAVLDAKGRGSGIEVGDSVLVGTGTVLSCSDAKINIGSDVSIGAQCCIRAGIGDVTIGDSVTIGSQSVVISGSPDYRRLDVSMKRQIGRGEGIIVGDDVWIGVGVRIIDGVRIGTGSVLGAGAVVIRDIPEYAIAAGVPAEIMGHRKDGAAEPIRT